HALRNPADQQSIIIRSDLDALAAAVRQCGGGFQKQKTALGGRRKQAAPARFLHQIVVVLSWFEPEQRKLESVLTARFSVATAAVASSFGENRHDLVSKINRRFGFWKPD